VKGIHQLRRNDVADLAAFLAIAEGRTFRAAAGRLGVTPSALSHSMRQLETRLGLRLLHRTTRSVSLTDAGQRLMAQLRPAMHQIQSALDALDGERQRPFGRLRIHAHPVAATAIASVWQRFLTTYPDVHLEIQTGETPVDIVAKGFDAGLTPYHRVPADMIAVRVVGPMKAAIVATPSYFELHKKPRSPDDLQSLDCVQFRMDGDGSLYAWQFERHGKWRKVRVSGRVTVNSADLALRAAVDGLGIAYTLEGIAEPFLRSGKLVRVLEEWSPNYQGMSLYYPGHRQIPAALRALIDMMRAGRDSRIGGLSLKNAFFASTD
jgi:DNA-binding transcriptional LysR family regulator